MTIREMFPRDSIGWQIAWRTHEIKEGIIFRAKYRSPVVRACRALARSIKPWGVISGGTDCDGMRYAGMSLHWTRKAAELSAKDSYNGAEGPHGADVVTGREAREWEAGYEPDTRDRYAESMGY